MALTQAEFGAEVHFLLNEKPLQMKLYKYLLLFHGTQQAAKMQSNCNLTVLSLQCCVIPVFVSFIK
jgi:hypothetical protein